MVDDAAQTKHTPRSSAAPQDSCVKTRPLARNFGHQAHTLAGPRERKRDHHRCRPPGSPELISDLFAPGSRVDVVYAIRATERVAPEAFAYALFTVCSTIAPHIPSTPAIFV